MNIRKSVIALALASALVIGAGSALAQDDSTPPTTEDQLYFRGPHGGFWGPGFGEHGPGFGPHGPRGHHFGPHGDGFGFQGRMRGGFGLGAELLEDYTGLDPAAIREAHMNGQTLAELIEANGQSVDDFIAAALASAYERLDTAVENDRITETVAAEMKANLEERLTAMVNGEFMQWSVPADA